MYLLLLLFGLLSGFPAWANNTVVDRLSMQKPLRCGYVSYAAAMEKDFKTGRWHGYDVEIASALAARLAVKMEYAAETSWALVPEDLKTHKYDMLCSTYWVNPEKAKFVRFSRPVYFQPVFLIARVKDARFDKSFVPVNDPRIKMAVLDADNPVTIAKADFPKVGFLTLPSNTNFTEVLVALADGKADVTIADANTFAVYNRTNPGRLKIVQPMRPIRIFPASFVTAYEDEALGRAVDNALDELILDGTVKRIMNRYVLYPHALYAPVIPYMDGMGTMHDHNPSD